MQALGFFTALAPEFGLFATLLTVLSGSVVAEQRLKNDKSLINFGAYFIVFFTISLIFYLVSFLGVGLPRESFFLFDQYAVDSFSLLFKIFLLVLFIPVVIIFRVYLTAERIYAYEFFVLALIALLGMFLMVSCRDFLLFYVALELQALSFYALAALRTDSLPSSEAGLKYFIIGVLASLLVLFGVALLYGYTGSTGFHALSLFFNYRPEFPALPVVAVLCLWVGLLIKLGAAPLHFWSLDVYQGSPLAVMGFFALLPKVTLIAVFLRLHYYVFSGPWLALSALRRLDILDYTFTNDMLMRVYWLLHLDFTHPIVGPMYPVQDRILEEPIYGLIMPAANSMSGTFYPAGPFTSQIVTLFLVLGLLSVVVGAIGGLGQTNLKRLFAYSSLTNVGFILLTFTGAGLNGFHATLFYTLVYIALTVSFLVILALLHSVYRRPVYSINDLAGLNLFFSIPLALTLLGLAGIPPTPGFAIKFYVYYLLVESGYYYSAAIVVVASVLAIFLYLRLIALLFFGPKQVAVLGQTVAMAKDLRVVYLLVTLVTVVFLTFLLPEIFDFCWALVFLFVGA